MTSIVYYLLHLFISFIQIKKSAKFDKVVKEAQTVTLKNTTRRKGWRALVDVPLSTRPIAKESFVIKSSVSCFWRQHSMKIKASNIFATMQDNKMIQNYISGVMRKKEDNMSNVRL